MTAPEYLDPVRHELHQLRADNDRMRAALTDLARHGTRHDLMPTHRPGDEAFWHRYIEDMDSNVRSRASLAIADKEPTP